MKLLWCSIAALFTTQTAIAALSLTPSTNEGGAPVILLQNTSETCSFSAYVVDFHFAQDQGRSWSRIIVDSLLADRPTDPIPPKGLTKLDLPPGEGLHSFQAAALCGTGRTGDPKLADLSAKRRVQYRTDLLKARVLLRQLRAEQAGYENALKTFQDWRSEARRTNAATERAHSDAEALNAATDDSVYALPGLLASRIKKQKPAVEAALSAIEEYLNGLESRLNAIESHR